MRASALETRTRGFTIVEMVVVIGIIMLLVGITGGVVRSATLEARAQKCASNLRQMAIATESYRNQSRGALPAAVLYEIRNSELVTRAWDFTQTQSGEIEAGRSGRSPTARPKCTSVPITSETARSGRIPSPATTTTPAISAPKVAIPS